MERRDLAEHQEVHLPATLREMMHFCGQCFGADRPLKSALQRCSIQQLLTEWTQLFRNRQSETFFIFGRDNFNPDP